MLFFQGRSVADIFTSFFPSLISETSNTLHSLPLSSSQFFIWKVLLQLPVQNVPDYKQNITLYPHLSSHWHASRQKGFIWSASFYVYWTSKTEQLLLLWYNIFVIDILKGLFFQIKVLQSELGYYWKTTTSQSFF